mmetsp:Transcript_7829/g.25623  ORF Transcript_7829/g.25623 Transcript_7829/m.25623 type:complete len:299 (-) Transcript_7829:1070-1966(-)
MSALDPHALAARGALRESGDGGSSAALPRGPPAGIIPGRAAGGGSGAATGADVGESKLIHPATSPEARLVDPGPGSEAVLPPDPPEAHTGERPAGAGAESPARSCRAGSALPAGIDSPTSRAAAACAGDAHEIRSPIAAGDFHILEPPSEPPACLLGAPLAAAPATTSASISAGSSAADPAPPPPPVSGMPFAGQRAGGGNIDSFGQRGAELGVRWAERGASKPHSASSGPRVCGERHRLISGCPRGDISTSATASVFSAPTILSSSSTSNDKPAPGDSASPGENRPLISAGDMGIRE